MWLKWRSSFRGLRFETIGRWGMSLLDVLFERFFDFFLSDVGISLLLISAGIFGGIKRYFPILKEILIEAYEATLPDVNNQGSK